jgi:hypothetical protein
MNDVRTVLLSAAIVEKLELIWVCCGCRVDLFVFPALQMFSLDSRETCRAIIRLNLKKTSVTSASSWNYIPDYYDAQTHKR